MPLTHCSCHISDFFMGPIIRSVSNFVEMLPRNEFEVAVHHSIHVAPRTEHCRLQADKAKERHAGIRPCLEGQLRSGCQPLGRAGRAGRVAGAKQEPRDAIGTQRNQRLAVFALVWLRWGSPGSHSLSRWGPGTVIRLKTGLWERLELLTGICRRSLVLRIELPPNARRRRAEDREGSRNDAVDRAERSELV